MQRQQKMQENKSQKTSFSISPYCILLFSNFLKLQIFDSNFINCSLQWLGWLHFECMRIPALNTANTTLGIYLLFENDHTSTQTRCKVCSNLTKCAITINFCLTSVFFINLERRSHPTLVLLSILLKGRCWLKVRRKIFVKIIQ